MGRGPTEFLGLGEADGRPQRGQRCGLHSSTRTQSNPEVGKQLGES